MCVLTFQISKVSSSVCIRLGNLKQVRLMQFFISYHKKTTVRALETVNATFLLYTLNDLNLPWFFILTGMNLLI